MMKHNMRKIIWIGCLCYLLIGFAHVVLGSLLEELLSYYNLTYSSGSQLVFNQFAGFLVGVLATPWFARRFGKTYTVALALVCLTVAETVYSFLPSWGWMLAAGPLAGFGFGMIEAAIGALIIDVVTERRASAMSRLEVFFGVGALLMPVAASLLIHYDLWAWCFPMIAALSFISLVLWLLMPLGGAARDAGSSGSPARGSAAGSPAPGQAPAPRYTARSAPLLAAMMLFFLLYVGVEMSFVHFLPSILIERSGASTSLATTGITAFWAAVVAGRLFAGQLSERFGYKRYLTASSSGMLVGLILFAFSPNLWVSFAIIIALGLAAAGIFAVALVFTNERLPGMTERTTSLLVASGGLGGALLPRLVGWSMDSFSLAVTMGLLVFCAALLVIFVCFALLYGKKSFG